MPSIASVVAFVAGAATVAAFAPFGLYPVALFTFGWLAHAWAARAPGECFLSGFAFGLGFFLGGVSWVYVSLHEFGGMPAALAALATLIFCAFLALFPAAAGWLQARIPARAALRATLVIPASWTLFEWLRSWIFTGFPWLSVGYAGVGWPLQGYAPLGGVFALSFLTLSLGGMLALLVGNDLQGTSGKTIGGQASGKAVDSAGGRNLPSVLLDKPIVKALGIVLYFGPPLFG